MCAAIAVLLLFPLFNLTASAVVAESEPVSKIGIFHGDCIIRKDKIFIPFAQFFREFGAETEWSSTANISKAVYNKNEFSVEFSVYMNEKPQAGDTWDNNVYADMTVTSDDKVFPVFFDTPAEIKNGTLYISSEVFINTFEADAYLSDGMVWVEFSEKNITETMRKETEKTEVVRLVNEIRGQKRLGKLKRNILLDKICALKARDKANFKYTGYEGHNSPVLGTVAETVERFTKRYTRIGECLAGFQNSADDVCSAWLTSDGHRKIFLCDWGSISE
jgi:uncharacterized protein YkwD